MIKSHTSVEEIKSWKIEEVRGKVPKRTMYKPCKQK